MLRRFHGPHAGALIYCYRPSLVVLGQAHLDGRQSRVQLLRHRVRAGPEFVPETPKKSIEELFSSSATHDDRSIEMGICAVLPPPLVRHRRHRRHHHRRAGAEHLVGVDQVVDGDEPLLHLLGQARRDQRRKLLLEIVRAVRCTDRTREETDKFRVMR